MQYWTKYHNRLVLHEINPGSYAKRQKRLSIFSPNNVDAWAQCWYSTVKFVATTVRCIKIEDTLANGKMQK